MYVVRQTTKLRALHAEAAASKQCTWGVDEKTGKIVENQVIVALAVKTRVLKTAFEAAALILKIDDIRSSSLIPTLFILWFQAWYLVPRLFTN